MADDQTTNTAGEGSEEKTVDVPVEIIPSTHKSTPPIPAEPAALATPSKPPAAPIAIPIPAPPKVSAPLPAAPISAIPPASLMLNVMPHEQREMKVPTTLTLSAPLPKAPMPAVPLSTGMMPIPPKVPTPPVAPQTPIPSASPLSAPVKKTGIENDIQKILKDIKMPERNDTKASADKNKHVVVNPGLDAMNATIPQQPPPKPVGVNILETPESKSELPKDPRAQVVAMHTLKDDLQSVVRDKKISVVRAVALEQEREKVTRPGSAEIGSQQRRSRTRAVLFASGLLFFLGAASLFGVYIVMTQSNQAKPSIETGSLVFAENTVLYPIDHLGVLDVKRGISQARENASVALGGITHIIPTLTSNPVDTTTQLTRAATFTEFLQGIGAHPPDELLRALDDKFFFGIHTVDKNAPFFVIQVTSYDHAFAGMLAWEKTMNPDLAPAFTAVPEFTKDINGIPSGRTFQDAVMRNYDTRILKDDAANVQLYYSFPTPGILIIAESPYTFTEVLARLRSARQI